MALANSTGRAGQPPRRNQKWQDVERVSHARTQSEIVESITLERNKGRTGLKIQDLTEGPSAEVNLMTYDQMQGYFNNILKSHRVIQRVEAYKDDRLVDEQFFEDNVVSEHLQLSPNVFKSILHLSDKLALELSKETAVGIDVDAEGSLYIYKRKTSDTEKLTSSAQGGRGKKPKKKEEEKQEKNSKPDVVKSIVRVHYIVD